MNKYQDKRRREALKGRTKEVIKSKLVITKYNPFNIILIILHWIKKLFKK